MKLVSISQRGITPSISNPILYVLTWKWNRFLLAKGEQAAHFESNVICSTLEMKPVSISQRGTCLPSRIFFKVCPLYVCVTTQRLHWANVSQYLATAGSFNASIKGLLHWSSMLLTLIRFMLPYIGGLCLRRHLTHTPFATDDVSNMRMEFCISAFRIHLQPRNLTANVSGGSPFIVAVSFARKEIAQHLQNFHLSYRMHSLSAHCTCLQCPAPTAHSQGKADT
jgi:hypothetical protein